MGEEAASIVIPTFQRRAALSRCLDAIAEQVTGGATYEVIVCVDGSTDGTADALRTTAYPFPLRVLELANRGRAAACNAGIRVAHGDLIVLLDDDMEPAPSWLVAHLAAHEASCPVGVMGAAPLRISPSDPPVAAYIARRFARHLESLATAGRPLRLRDVYTGNFSIPHHVLLGIGGFDEDFTRYGNEDLELAVRLAAAGVDIRYSPDAIAHQHYIKDFAALGRDNRDKGHTAVLLARKHPEVVAQLRLASDSTGSGRWRAARHVLLALGRVWPGLPGHVSDTAELLVRHFPSAADSIYSLTLDYLFWTGAHEAYRAEGSWL